MILLLLLLRVGLLSGALWLAGHAARHLPLALRRRVGMFSLFALAILAPLTLLWQSGVWNVPTEVRPAGVTLSTANSTPWMDFVIYGCAAVYLSGIALGLARFVMGAAGLVRLPVALAPHPAQALLRTLCPDRSRRPRLLMSARCSLPFTTGLWPFSRGWIVLPVAVAMQRDRAMLAAILRHELQHLKAQDPLLAVVSRLLCALFWPIPFVHALSAQLEEVQEAEADWAAVDGQALPVKALYAECLISLAAQAAPCRPAAMICRAVGRSLACMESRIRLILSDRPAGAADLAARRMICRGVALLLVVSLPILFLIGVSPEHAMPAQSVRTSETSPRTTLSLERMEQVLRGGPESAAAADLLNREELQLRDGL